MSVKSSPWTGKVAVVTGAASGIGLALVRRFVAESMTVVMVDRHAGRLREAAASIGADGGRLLEIDADVGAPAAVQRVADRVAEDAGDVHVLCNNAGVLRPGSAWDVSDADWTETMDVNVRGVVNGIRAFVPRMLAHEEDCVVMNTASAVGLHTVPGFASYCVSKAAVVALSEALAAEVAGVPGARLRVSVLCPGSVVTNLSPENIGGRSDRMDPDWVADHAWQAIQNGAFWVLPMQEDMRRAALDRSRRVEHALADAPVPDPPRVSVIPTFLTSYFERVDGPDPASALDLVSRDATFSFARPGERIEGGRNELAGYIAARSPLGHHLLRSAEDRDVAFVLGESVDGHTPLGTFIAAARRDQAGRIDRYLAAFYPGSPEV